MAAAVASAVKNRNDRERAEIEANGGKKPVKKKVKEVIELPPENQTGIWKYQRQAAQLYLHIKIQVFVAGLIAGNFMANIIEEWVDPEGTEYELVWTVFDNMFNVLFFMELCLNMYAFWLCKFWKSAWNVFDFVVVSIGMLGLLQVPLPGPLGMLRMMRAFRVFRLFKRIKSLNKLMVALGKALPGVFNAFIIVVLVMAIYAILGVEFFSDYAAEGFYINEMGNPVNCTTSREMTYGDEYFGNFGKSMYTMFQVLTGESWSEAVARPLLYSNNPVQTFGVAFYFCSFNLVVGVVLINVVVAVLLEKMVDDEPAGDDGGGDEEEEEEAGGAPDGEEPADQGPIEVKAEPKAIDVSGKDTLTIQSKAQGKLGWDKLVMAEGNVELSQMEADCVSLRQDMTTVKAQLRQLAETFQTMEPVFVPRDKQDS